MTETTREQLWLYSQNKWLRQKLAVEQRLRMDLESYHASLDAYSIYLRLLTVLAQLCAVFGLAYLPDWPAILTCLTWELPLTCLASALVGLAVGNRFWWLREFGGKVARVANPKKAFEDSVIRLAVAKVASLVDTAGELR